MIFAKYKKQFGLWFLIWSVLVTFGAVGWIGDNLSPLVRPDVWGVIDWLGSSAVLIALWGGARLQFSRDLPNRSRLEDVLFVLKRFACGLGLLAILYAATAVRISVYGWPFDPTLSLLRPAKSEPFFLWLPLYFVMMGIVAGVMSVIFGMVAVATRNYDQRSA